jgi:hypothetical protein
MSKIFRGQAPEPLFKREGKEEREGQGKKGWKGKTGDGRGREGREASPYKFFRLQHCLCSKLLTLTPSPGVPAGNEPDRKLAQNGVPFAVFSKNEKS